MAFSGADHSDSTGFPAKTTCSRRNKLYDTISNALVRVFSRDGHSWKYGHERGSDIQSDTRSHDSLRAATEVDEHNGPNSLPTRALALMWSLLKRVIRRCQPVSIVLFVVFIAFGIGFVVFSEKVANMETPATIEQVDGIVVLTGGQARVDVALGLLKDNRGRRLLISGVHPTTKPEVLQRITHTDPRLFDCCVDLDRSAMNTIGNAIESARWIRANGYKRVIIVTNNYHMPRSLLELSRLMNDVEFVPYPVINTDLRQNSWMRQGDTLRVLLTEYVKYLGAAVGLTKLSIFGGMSSEH